MRTEHLDIRTSTFLWVKNSDKLSLLFIWLNLILQAPNNSGSEFYNYKQFFSIVLLAAVNVNAEFITYDIGAAGRMSDSQIFNNSNMKVTI